jgi:hypothetical protein
VRRRRHKNVLSAVSEDDTVVGHAEQQSQWHSPFRARTNPPAPFVKYKFIY